MELVPIHDIGTEVSLDQYAKLEEGNVLFVDRIPIDFSEDDYVFLLSQRQTEAAYRKNIAYKPAQRRTS